MAKEKTLTINGVNFSLLTSRRDRLMLSNEYTRAECRHNMYLWDVYGSCSGRKQRAWDDCNAIRIEVNGGRMYIASYNTMMFTLVYTLEFEGKKYVVKETPSHRYICEWDY